MPWLVRTVLRAAAAVMLAIGVPLAPSLAQMSIGGSSRNPDTPSLTADIGFGGPLWPNRWTPINIHVIGGAKAFEGEITISYAQDDRLGALILRTVTATPGKTTTFGTMVNLPQNCSEVLVSLRRPGVGRPVAQLVLSAYPDLEKNEAHLPPVQGTSPLVVALGDREDRALAAVRALADPDDNRGGVGVVNPEVSYLSPTRLPPTWAALDSALLVVTTGDAASGCDPRTLAAVREWVSSGGRLVILATTPGDGWRNWLAASPEQPLPVALAPARIAPTPADLAATLGWLPPKPYPAPQVDYTSAVAPRITPVDRDSERVETLPPAATLPVRPLSISGSGEGLGWSLRYPLEDNPAAAFAAEGPFGFGWVVVAGFNPDLVAGTVTADAARRVWFDLLENSLADWRARETSSASLTFGHANGAFTAGGFTVSDIDAQLAGNMALDQVSNVPALTNAAFPVLAVGILVLALLLGPIDAFVLRKARARHRSWATAIGWITLASLAAYFIPGFVRSGDTIVNRFTVLDASQVGLPQGAALPAWRTGVTGVFAGASFQQRFEGPLGGSWWRPASGHHLISWRPTGASTPRRSITTHQSLPDFSSLATESDPWAGFAPAHPGAGGNLLTPTSLKLWTFHTYEEQARASTPLRADVRMDSSMDPPKWSVELRGIPEGATVRLATLRVMIDEEERWHSLSFEDAGGRFLATADTHGAPEPPKLWAPLDQNQATHLYYPGWGQTPAQQPNYALAFQLPGPDRRGLAVTHAVKRGDAALYLVLRSMPPDVSLDLPESDPLSQSHTQVLRLIVPVTRSGNAAPAGPAQETSK